MYTYETLMRASLQSENKDKLKKAADVPTLKRSSRVSKTQIFFNNINIHITFIKSDIFTLHKYNTSYYY